MGVSALPHLNAVINTAVAILLVVGLVLIKRGNKLAHQRVMTASLILSALFFASYIVYHLEHGSTKFTGVGPVRTVYFTLLLTHTVLAVINLPFVILTVFRAWTGNFVKHRRIGRVTWYMWFYVAATGPMVYLMLYQLYPASRLEDEVRAARALHERGEEEAALIRYRALAEAGHVGSSCFAAVLGARMDEKETPRELLEQHADDAACLTLLGRELIYSNELDRAIALLEKATTLAPKDPFTHDSLAFAYFRKLEYQKAARSFEHAIELQPEKAVHRGNAGYAHYHYGNYAAARPHIVHALELGMDGEFADRLKEALAVIDGAKWICPMHPDVVGKHGEMCSACGMPLEPAARSPVTE